MLRQANNRSFLREVANVMLVMRETFISILPVYLLMSLLELVSTLVPDNAGQHHFHAMLELLLLPTKRALPFLVAALLGYKLAKYKKIEPLLGAAICAVSLAVVLAPMNAAGNNGSIATVFPSIYSIVLPLWSVFLYCLLRRCRFLFIEVRVVSQLLANSINGIVPTLLIVVANAATFHYVSIFLLGAIGNFGDVLSQLPLLVQGSIRIIVVHALWFVGIHGNYVYTSLTYGQDLQQIVTNQFTLGSLLNTFVLFGGAGGTLAMLVAIIVRRHTVREQLVAKISFPLQLFNINDILLFGYPIVFNPYLLAPFILFPLLGFWLAYAVAVFDWVPLVENVHWIMPIGVNAWKAGGGSVLALLFQLAMLALGAAIYYPFLAWENGDAIKQKLRRVFATDDLPEAQLEVREDNYLQRQKSALQSHAQAMETFRLLASGKLELWYQPQVDLRNMQVYGFEALLRLRMQDGKIVGPWFIERLEKAGYSDALNSWVVNQALEDLRVWKEEGFEPRISINLTADFLSSEEKVKALLSRVDSGLIDLNLEMLESSFTEKFSELVDNVNLLRAHGVTLSIDDFGTGYSNLALLHKLGIDSVKLDKSLVADSAKPRGALLYRELCGLLKAFDYRLVAEGVETAEQLAFVSTCNIDIVQGWYFAAAMPPDQARRYTLPA